MVISTTASWKGMIISMAVAGLPSRTLGAHGTLAGNTTQGPVQEIGSTAAGPSSERPGPAKAPAQEPTRNDGGSSFVYGIINAVRAQSEPLNILRRPLPPAQAIAFQEERKRCDRTAVHTPPPASAASLVPLVGNVTRGQGRTAVIQVTWELWQDPSDGSQSPVTVRVIDDAGHLIHMISFPAPDAAKH
jgi:hypothetical protein